MTNRSETGVQSINLLILNELPVPEGIVFVIKKPRDYGIVTFDEFLTNSIELKQNHNCINSHHRMLPKS